MTLVPMNKTFKCLQPTEEDTITVINRKHMTDTNEGLQRMNEPRREKTCLRGSTTVDTVSIHASAPTEHRTRMKIVIL